MKQVFSFRSLKFLKVTGFFSILLLSVFLLSSYNKANRTADDLWKQLGISQQLGSDKIKNSFMSGYLDYWGVKNIKSIATGDKASLAKDLLTYTKTYLNSSAVKTAYASERESAKPVPEETINLSKDEIRKREIATMKKAIDDAEKLLKQFPDMEKSVRKTITQFEKTIVDFQAPDSKIINIMYEAQIANSKMKETQYAESLQRWEENYPSDYRLKLRSYLEKYLSVATTVDFNAALTEKYNKKVFVNPGYEGKNDEWKMIFRAGKDVYGVAKPFAEQWLKELSAK